MKTRSILGPPTLTLATRFTASATEFLPPALPAAAAREKPAAADIRLGIAITTLNRRNLVYAQIAAIRALTTTPFTLVMCDDGSADGTQILLRSAGEMVIGGVSRGIAWNKNRGIFYLMAVQGCDVVLLLDDDVIPTEPGWQQYWVDGASRHGMVNFCAAGAAGAPEPRSAVTGQCIGFHRYAWSMVGYMAPGHGHAEFCGRFAGHGFGGDRDGLLTIGGGLRSLAADRPAPVAAVSGAAMADQQPMFHLPWLNDSQRDDLLAEIALTLREKKIIVPLAAPNF